MQRSTEKLSSTGFRLIVIGGGIDGLLTARGAAHRELRLALVEARDFGDSTSIRTAKSIRGATPES